MSQNKSRNQIIDEIISKLKKDIPFLKAGYIVYRQVTECVIEEIEKMKDDETHGG